LNGNAIGATMVEGSGLEPLGGQDPETPAGTNRPPSAQREGSTLYSRPFPLPSSCTFGGGRARMHTKPRSNATIAFTRDEALRATGTVGQDTFPVVSSFCLSYSPVTVFSIEPFAASTCAMPAKKAAIRSGCQPAISAMSTRTLT
jgi:hypothetical protein